MSKPSKIIDARRLRRLKQVAKQLKKQHKLSHAEALDRVAREDGHPNWKAILKLEKVSRAEHTPILKPSLDFLNDDSDAIAAEDAESIKLERSEDIDAEIKVLVSNNRLALARLGIEHSIFEPTVTGLKKSILDATQNVRTHFRLIEFHDYDVQKQGPEYKQFREACFVDPNKSMKTKVSLYRPITKNGDPRMWFYNLGSFVEAGDQIAIVVLEKTAYLFNFSRINLDECLAENGEVYELLQTLVEESESVAKDLLGKLREIARQPLKGVGSGDTSIGMTVEAALGIPANSSKKPDYNGIELKSGRGAKTRATLFAQVADWERSPCKSSREILEKYGYDREDDYKLYCTVSSRKSNSQGLKFEIDARKDDLAEVDSDGNIVVIWSGDVLRERLREKHTETFWIQADSYFVDKEEYFKLRSVVHTKGPLLNQLMTLIGSGVITMDHLIKRKGGVGGRVSEKGPLYKIDKRNLPLLFPKPVKHTLV